MIEVYGDPAVVRRNASAPWFGEYMRAAAPLVDGAPRMATAVPQWAKGYAL